MKTTVIHHSADYDGIFCREIAKKFLPEAELIGWDFADAPIAIPDGQVYVMDLPVDRVFGYKWIQSSLIEELPDPLPDLLGKRLVWIDHHKSSIETHPTDIPGYRIDGVAACRLAWFYFTALERYKKQTLTADFTWFQGHYPWATKQDFVDRKVEEPLAVRLAGEYDIWDKRDARADTFQYSLRATDLTTEVWERLLRNEAASENIVRELLPAGEAAQKFSQKTDSDLVKYKSFRLRWEGLDFLCLNTGRFNSLTFAALDKPETGHDALLGFMWNGKLWTVSLYHANHRKDLDLSLIAVKHGGGGHKGACGFITEKLPFLQ